MRRISSSIRHGDLSGSRAYLFIKFITDTAYTLSEDDFNCLLLFTSASAVTVTVPEDLTVNQQIDFSQYGNGIVTFFAAGSVVINSENDNLSIGSRFAPVSLVTIDTNTCLLVGTLI